jgi:hypothetical protein
MAIIVVGGSGKGVGKTALVCGLIAALPEFRWMAVKITSEDHGNPEPIQEETGAGQGTDTARYLAAGARRALLVSVPDGYIPLGQIWDTLGAGADLIFESNRIAAHLRPNLCIGVLGGHATQTKPSFTYFRLLTDALVVRADIDAIQSPAASAKPEFGLANLECISPEMLAWVREKLRPNRLS